MSFRMYFFIPSLYLNSCGILKEYVRYTELIEELGKYASEMYLYETPLFRLVKTVFSDENHQFPQLDEKQSKILWAFLKEIYDGKKPPEALLMLISNLMFCDNFENAISSIRIWRKGYNKDNRRRNYDR